MEREPVRSGLEADREELRMKGLADVDDDQ